MKYDPLALGIRGLVLDTGVFSEYDEFYTEYALRLGVQHLMNLVTEHLGAPPEVMFVQPEGHATIERAIRYFVPMSPQVLRLAEESGQAVPRVLISDTLLAILLGVENGTPSLMFKALYTAAIEHDDTRFRLILREFAPLHPFVPEFGQTLHRLYTGQTLPDPSELQALAADLSARAIQAVAGPAPEPTPPPAAQQQTPVPPRGPQATDPNSLN